MASLSSLNRKTSLDEVGGGQFKDLRRMKEMENTFSDEGKPH